MYKKHQCFNIRKDRTSESVTNVSETDNICELKLVGMGGIALVLCFRFRSRTALSPDVKSVSIVWATEGVIGNVS